MLHTVMCTPPPQTEVMCVTDMHPFIGDCCIPLPADPPAVDVLLWLHLSSSSSLWPPNSWWERPRKVTPIHPGVGLPMLQSHEWGAGCPQNLSHRRGLCLFQAEVVMLVGQLLAVSNLVCCSSSFPLQGLSLPVANYHESFTLLLKVTSSSFQ